MSNENKGSGLKVLGGLLIFSSLLSFCFDYMFSANRHTPVSLLLMNLVSSLAIFPRGIPWLLHYFSQSSVNAGFNLILVWRICIILCGLGIFFFKKIGRIALIVFSMIHIIIFAFSSLLIIASRPGAAHYASGNGIIDVLIKMNINVFVWLLPLAYCIYLFLPRIRRQFK